MCLIALPDPLLDLLRLNVVSALRGLSSVPMQRFELFLRASCQTDPLLF